MKISFIIPVYNCGNLIFEAINSIVQSNFLEYSYEIVLVNDCSTDSSTLSALTELSKRDDVVLIHLRNNGGPARARNAGIRAATGEWIGFLDADDYFAPGAIEFRLRIITSQAQAKWIAGDNVDVVAPNETRHPNLFAALSDEKQIADGAYIMQNPTKKLLLIGSTPLLGSMMIRRDELVRLRGFDDRLTYGEDSNLFYLLSLTNDLYWISKPQLYLRRYNESMTKNLLKIARELPRSSRALLLDWRFREFRKELRWRHADVLRRASDINRKHGKYLASFFNSLEAIFWVPNDIRNYMSVTGVIKHLLKKR